MLTSQGRRVKIISNARYSSISTFSLFNLLESKRKLKNADNF